MQAIRNPRAAPLTHNLTVGCIVGFAVAHSTSLPQSDCWNAPAQHSAWVSKRYMCRQSGFSHAAGYSPE